MKEKIKNKIQITRPENFNQSSRRGFLGHLTKAAIASAAFGAIGIKPLVGGKESETAAQSSNGLANQRRSDCKKIRDDASKYGFQNTPANLSHPNNGDEALYPNRIANFSKGMPHQSNGEVVPSAYNALLLAVNTGSPSNFEQIPLGGNRRFTNPQAGLAFDLEGADSHALVLPPPPSFASREIAAEIAENYWMAVLRDLPMEQYVNDPIAAAAAADLNLFGSDFKGAKNASGKVTPELLFRGLTPGDKTGHYFSQFLYQPMYFGANQMSQQIRTVRAIADGGQDYMTDFDSWLRVQNGVSQGADNYASTARYIQHGRDIGQYVHVDVLFQAYFQAFLVLDSIGAPYDQNNPYNFSNNQAGFGTFGGPHIASLLSGVATKALKVMWYQKWFVHRRLRPEVFAARIDRRAFHGANYPVHSEILNSINSSSRLGGYLNGKNSGNALLPMAFPEGSPTHPAYGAGHATVAGACVTLLKAFFDETFVIPNPLMPDESGQNLIAYSGNNLTVGGELNKLANNIALGRNIAGVHWRSDGTESLKLGETLAISVLRDQKEIYNEQFFGFNLTKFDGASIVI